MFSSENIIEDFLSLHALAVDLGKPCILSSFLLEMYKLGGRTLLLGSASHKVKQLFYNYNPKQL